MTGVLLAVLLAAVAVAVASYAVRLWQTDAAPTDRTIGAVLGGVAVMLLALAGGVAFAGGPGSAAPGLRTAGATAPAGSGSLANGSLSGGSVGGAGAVQVINRGGAAVTLFKVAPDGSEQKVGTIDPGATMQPEGAGSWRVSGPGGDMMISSSGGPTTFTVS